MFIRSDADRHRLPVILLSGFLGSGKTTLVNALIRDPRLADTAIAVNEFGEVPIDHHLIDQGGDRTVVMANGCLCCNIAGDMEDSVMRIFSLGHGGGVARFRRLIVEPSGLADPAPIAQAILRNPLMSRALRFEGIVTAVDTVFAEAQLAHQPESRTQVALADRLVLTKLDLAEPEAIARVTALLRRLNPVAPILEASHGVVDPALLLPPAFLMPEAPRQDDDHAFGKRASGHVEAIHHTDATSAICLYADQPLSWPALDAWLRRIRIDYAAPLLRLKGLLNLAEARQPVVIHGVHHVMHPPVELERWPDADRRSRLVMILRGLAPGTIRARWDAALPDMLASHAGAPPS